MISPPGPWTAGVCAAGRKMAVLAFIVVTTVAAALVMADLVWGMPMRGWNGVVLLLYTMLVSIAALGAGLAFFGFLARRRGGDAGLLTRSLPPEEAAAVPLARTAVIMPVCNEDARRVCAGLRAVYRSLERTGQLEHFDFFLLSDSDEPDCWIDEELGWAELCRELDASGRLFYRRRRARVNKKAGNVADFCRRWGRRYRYMVVLDADSLIAGGTVVQMVRLMERNRRVGIIQSAPFLFRAETLFARVLQFGMSLYGPVFLSGLNYWQQGEGNYWGHNAIIRIAPFMRHCSLPALPGREPLGGRILSHDFVEAALLRRAGWAVWLLPDVGGSYEEAPPTLIDAARRDRRWCQGNLQHTWLLFARGLRPMSRVHLFLGIYSYCVSVLWLLFLLLSLLLTVGFNRTGLTWVPDPGIGTTLGISPTLESAALFVFTVSLVFGPKLLAVADRMLQRGGFARLGGAGRVFASIALESVFTGLLAPVLMMFHAKFVVGLLLGRGTRWLAQRRSLDGGLGWKEAWRAHGGHTLLGLGWVAVLARLSPSLLGWMSPVLGGLVFSVPLSRLGGSIRLGQRARSRGLFCSPEELAPPRELTELEEALARTDAAGPGWRGLKTDPGLARAVFDPFVNAIHLCLLRDRANRAEEVRQPFEIYREKLLRDGPDALSRKEKLALLSDAESVDWLHREVWRRPPDKLATWWRRALEHPARADDRVEDGASS